MSPPHPSRLAPCHLPLIGEGFGAQKTENLPAKRCSPTNSGCTFYFPQRFQGSCYQIGSYVSGGAYQDAREVSIEWNARPKYWDLPKIRCSMHPASPRTLFSPIFSLAREKMGPPEAPGSCKFDTTSQSRLRRASIPTPFVPSGHFPLIGGIGPWEGSQGGAPETID